MERPLPATDEERFDIVSLSLVVNFVPEAAARGEMLRRTVQFLRATSDAAKPGHPFPSLFLVLPLSCVTNARYMNEARLGEILQSLGYSRFMRKLSTKLAYYLWVLGPEPSRKSTYKKVEVNPGRTRNNFAIVLN
jgi:25S rRNA (adenine2142-N1)-methyltransferase